jgi:hypothetical protein
MTLCAIENGSWLLPKFTSGLSRQRQRRSEKTTILLNGGCHPRASSKSAVRRWMENEKGRLVWDKEINGVVARGVKKIGLHP